LTCRCRSVPSGRQGRTTGPRTSGRQECCFLNPVFAALFSQGPAELTCVRALLTSALDSVLSESSPLSADADLLRCRRWRRNLCLSRRVTVKVTGFPPGAARLRLVSRDCRARRPRRRRRGWPAGRRGCSRCSRRPLGAAAGPNSRWCPERRSCPRTKASLLRATAVAPGSLDSGGGGGDDGCRGVSPAAAAAAVGGEASLLFPRRRQRLGRRRRRLWLTFAPKGLRPQRTSSLVSYH
jgi:hypothetical protein